jgi:hypothetical protein
VRVVEAAESSLGFPLFAYRDCKLVSHLGQLVSHLGHTEAAD